MLKLYRFLASGFGVSYLPPLLCKFKKNTGAGFLGTLVAVPVSLILPADYFCYAVFLICFTLFAVWVAYKAQMPVPDDPRIVIDEMAGYFFAIAFLPKTWQVLLAAFVIFRILDTIKPFYINRLDKIKNAAGVVLDDVASGVLTCLIINFWIWLEPNLGPWFFK